MINRLDRDTNFTINADYIIPPKLFQKKNKVCSDQNNLSTNIEKRRQHFLKKMNLLTTIELLVHSFMIKYEIRKLKILFQFKEQYPANVYFFKVNNGNSRKRCELCSKLDVVLVFLLCYEDHLLFWRFYVIRTFTIHEK